MPMTADRLLYYAYNKTSAWDVINNIFYKSAD